MRVLKLGLVTLLVSGGAIAAFAAISDTGPQVGSGLREADLVELCDPGAGGEKQLYCRYYIMGLMDGLAMTADVCLPPGSSSERIRRAVASSVGADPDRTHQPAVNGIRAALSRAFPCV